MTKNITERVVVSQHGQFKGEARDWAYSHPALVVREIAGSDDEHYPVIEGEEICDVVTTDYKLQVYWKDK